MNIADLTKKRLYKDNPRNLGLPFEKAWGLVEANCSEFLSVAKQTNRVLYRGVSKYRYTDLKNCPGVFLGKSRDDRMPIDSDYKNKNDISVYAKLSDFYLKTAGFTALRCNSIFCNSNYRQASPWGNVYVIFPINGFSFGYSTIHSRTSASGYDLDFTLGVTDKMLKIFDYQISGRPLTGIEIPTEEDCLVAAKEYVNLNGLTNKDLGTAMKTNQDMWFNGRYIAFNHAMYDNNLSVALYGIGYYED